MRNIRLQGLLAGSAMALVLAGGITPVWSDPAGDAATLSNVPMPAPADVKPPGVADVETTASMPAAPAAGEGLKGQEAAAPAAETPSTVAPSAAAPAVVPTPPAMQAETPAPQAAPVQAAALTLDQQVGEKVRELLTAKSDRYFDRKQKPSVDAFYAARNNAPLWSENGELSARAKAVNAYLNTVDADGLDPADYVTPVMKAGASVESLADAEMKFTATVLTYAKHAANGRVHFSRVGADIAYEPTVIDPSNLLGKLAEGGNNAAKTLDSFEPQHTFYKALKAKYAELRGPERTAARFEHGATLKVGMDDARVPMLRERLGVAGEGQVYDKTLAEAVKKLQRDRDLAPSGNLTASTVDALNGQKREKTGDIILANLERWRWAPHDLGEKYVVTNVPDYTLHVYNKGETVWSTKIVAGKPGNHATPVLTETMKYITVNPTWNVPPSIINNEYLPALQRDPEALARIGLKVEYNRDGSVRIYQPPGERNALGRIRFNFPNKFLVYQHDTPDKNLFAQETRAFSHGCMRVQNPDKYAEVILSLTNPNDRYTAERIRKMYGSAEQDIRLQTHIPVHITYQTAFVDEHGKLAIRKDVYGRDARLIAILKGDERRMADISMDRREPAVRRPVARAPEPVRQQAGFNFFGMFR